MTPEGKVKIWLDKWLITHLPGHWKVKPRGGPFGKGGCPDVLICWKGLFIAIEVKAEGGQPTALQMTSLTTIHDAGGIAVILRGRDEAKLLKMKDVIHERLNSKT